ncbi:glycine betaine ABC transporter substrate-binding protein [Chelativorans xinjiangense]|uniref:glycine betaine ABC transporter substrate-binding protein n=1 Tax=Chelativorans xinjiangense TaxID=2681485 RepID=UPI001356C409|nr:glycine betaine ABC transporter substrate-binding protein [Chelativorans xinjiangense]
MSKRLGGILASLIFLLLAACSDSRDTITVGSKNFGESNVLAHMFAILIREEAIPVAGPIEYPNTQSILEALKRGDVDIYPDYNGTGLVMIGQNPLSDGDAATTRVQELYAPLGLTWLPRLGFANNFGLAMRADRAQELGVESISDLAAHAGDLTFGIEADFETRPLDGLQPLTARYGMEFGSLDVVPLDERNVIYDKLLDGVVDVGEVYTTDGQITDYGMVVLDDDLSFFPVYEAAPLARTGSLERHPALREAMEALAGKIDADTMRTLNSRVDIDGRSAETVARAALAEMGLVEGGVVTDEEPLVISASPLLAETGYGNAALRAARRAFTGREVELAASTNPLSAIGTGDARIALVEADAFFNLSGAEAVRNERFEAVAAVGQSVVHLLARTGTDTRAIGSIVVGPPGSAGNRLGTTIAAGLGLEATVEAAEEETAEALLATMESSGAEGILVVAPMGDETVAALTEGTGLTLRALDGWKEQANLVRFPFLREVRVPSGTYPRQFTAIDTLGEQVVLAGVAPDTTDMVGDQGPGAVATSISALPGTAVTALVDAIPGTTLIDPTLKQAAALAPPEPELPAAINPALDVSLLNLAIVLLILWLGWLYIRPEHR